MHFFARRRVDLPNEIGEARHAVPAALVGDVVAAIATVAVCAWMF